MNIKLGEASGKSNNLQLLRFLAAVMVIMSHAFVISTGTSEKEWLISLTQGNLSMGGFSVSVFFCAGGYLIAKSVCRAKTARKYFAARALRIFPLLIVVVLLSMFVLGPMMTSLSLKEYFSSSELYEYILNGVLILRHNLPGVFLESPYSRTVNGPLWTLPIEFLCYVGCFIMYKFKMLEKKQFVISIPLVVIGCGGIWYLAKVTGIEVLLAAIRPGLLFYIGILLYVYRDKIVLNGKIALLGAAFIVVTAVFSNINIAMILAFPYVLMYVCFGMKQVSEKLGRLGDLSYGMYLCGYPIQQVNVIVMGGKMNPYVNMIISIPITILIAAILYRLIEKPIFNWEKSRRNK